MSNRDVLHAMSIGIHRMRADVQRAKERALEARAGSQFTKLEIQRMEFALVEGLNAFFDLAEIELGFRRDPNQKESAT